jgi:putative pyruvate formate lyase activating enzyme
MLRLQAEGCHNINFVTPEHVAPQLVEAIAVAVPLGLRLPIVYNTSAYDAIASLKLMAGLIDIYMPDFKLWESDSSRRLARARDYPDRARTAIEEMHRQVGVLRFGPDGLARRGVLVRHLVMPGYGDEAAAIFRWLHDAISPDTYLNIMGQYRPEHRVPGTERYADIDRCPAPEEMAAAFEAFAIHPAAFANAKGASRIQKAVHRLPAVSPPRWKARVRGAYPSVELGTA